MLTHTDWNGRMRSSPPPGREDRHRIGVFEPVAVAAHRDTEPVVGDGRAEQVDYLRLVAGVRERAPEQVFDLVAELVETRLRLAKAGAAEQIAQFGEPQAAGMRWVAQLF